MKSNLKKVTAVYLALACINIFSMRPVQADDSVHPTSGSGVVDLSDNVNSARSDVESLQEVGQAQDKGYDMGEKTGYQDGLRVDAPKVPKDPRPTPSTNPYSSNPEAKSTYDEAYKDGYEFGYRKGWDDGHPIQATLDWLWITITSWFSSFI
ncbi:TPA: hypothetical protein VJO90_001639 [Streptococcus pyogenes]|nr:hypothetical protein [Streptococcus pyogenes]